MLPEGSPIFYLELNDDALIRDIVSGVYTGAPVARDIQNLYPFGLIVSLLYRILPEVPWFGGLLFALQALALLVILVRSIGLVRRDRLPIRIRLGITLIWAAITVLILPHFLFVQYSVTVGLLAAAAAYLFITGDATRHYVGGVVLTGTAFLIRSEMLLLLLPMILVALLFRYAGEIRASRADNEELPGFVDLIRYPFITSHYRRFGVTFLSLILVLAACWSLDRIGYAPEEWDSFVRFFDARTEVYDFTGVPAWEGNEEFYRAVGLDESDVTLLENYNFGLAEEIDADAMERIAEYGRSLLPSAAVRLGKAAREYFYRLHHLGFPEDFTWPQTDAPWNLVVLFLYLALGIAVWLRTPDTAERGRRIGNALWRPIVLFSVRSVLWLWLLSTGRAPVRVTGPLFYVETAILSGALLMLMLKERAEVVRETDRKDPADREAGTIGAKERISRSLTILRIALAAAIAVIACVYGVQSCRVIEQEESKRALANQAYTALRDRCARDRDSLYLFDVYSSVAETRPLFREARKTGRPDNLDLLGGWAVKSPAWRDKLDRYGFDDAAEALLADDVYFVTREGEEFAPDWIIGFYAARGQKVQLTLIEELPAAQDGTGFVIYQVREG
ncbi:MAG: hypothetical protein II800_01200 [Lachnospiraceae bacterium]|nr:hypothetical protein [Lachnospiraceae bacterium]